MIKLSIIIPVYNTPIKKLQRCFDSVNKITSKDYECLIIDDGSDKQIGAYIRDYCVRNPNFHYLFQKNKGVSSARNLGIENAEREYLCFVDSDDEIVPQVYDCFLAEHHSEEIIFSDYIWENGKIQERRKLSKNKCITYETIIKKIIESGDYSSPCCKYMRRDFLNRYHIRFDESMCFAEDLSLFLDILLKKPSMCYLDAVSYVYHWRLQTGRSRLQRIAETGLEYQTKNMNKKEKLIQLGDFTEEEKDTLRKQTVTYFIEALFSITLSMTGYGLYTQKVDHNIKKQIVAVNLSEVDKLTKIKRDILLSKRGVVRRMIAKLRNVYLKLRGL